MNFKQLFHNNARTSADSAYAVTAAVVVAVVAVIPLLTMPMLVGTLVEQIGLTARQAGFIVAADMAGAAVSALLIVFGIHRWNWKGLLFAAAAAMLLSNALFRFFDSFSALLLLRFVSGLGEGAMAAISNTAIGKMRYPVRVYGISYIGQMGMASTFIFLFPTLLEYWGMVGVYAVISVSALSVLLVLPWFPDRTAQAGIEVSAEHRPKVVWEPSAVLATLLYFITTGGVWAYFERMGVTAGVATESISKSLAVATLVGIVGASVVAWAGTRFGILRSYFCTIALAVGSIFILLGDMNSFSFAVSAAMFMFAWNAAVPYLLETLAKADPSGRLVAFGTALAFGGLMLGPILAVLFTDGEDYRQVCLMGIAFYVLSIALFLPLMRKIGSQSAFRLTLTVRDDQ